MHKITIQKSTIDFLKALSKNNNREWFNEHKSNYLKAQENMSEFVDELIHEMNKHDELESTTGKKSLYRIYSDVRFSKDKSPYKARFAFGFQRATKYRRGGYYVNLNPGNSFMACGFFNPNSEDLKRIREDIQLNYKTWKKLLSNKSIKTNFGEMIGEKVASSPRGYEKNHPAIDLLKHKQFIFRIDFTDKEVLSENFSKTINANFKAIRPFLNYMSEVLTTDLNGVSIFEK
jgi:uncharacterized protein (TIGR02453 family)